jgi:hypothetical protein
LPLFFSSAAIQTISESGTRSYAISDSGYWNAEIAAETAASTADIRVHHEQNVFRRYDVSISSFCLRALKSPPAHHGGQAVRSPEFAADTAASTVWLL